MTQAISQDEFSDLWMNKLTEQQRMKRAEAAFKITRAVAKKQIVLIACNALRHHSLFPPGLRP